MIEILVYIAILVIVLIFVFWLIQQIPANLLPGPLKQIVSIVLVVIAVVALIIILLQLTGTGPSLRLPR